MTSEGESRDLDILIAVANGDSSALARSIEAGGDANARDRWGVPALAIAAGRGDLECLRLLLDHDADGRYPEKIGFGYTLARKPR